MKIYIAGPMSGMAGYNIPNFNVTAKALRAAGHEVVNPAEIGEAFGTPEEIEEDLLLLKKVIDTEMRELATCDTIYLLKGWERSDGARRELTAALALYMRIIAE